MPVFKLKKVWDYCSYNIPFFALILILIFTLTLISESSLLWVYPVVGFAVSFVISVILTGYGISITRDRINHGHRLPKILPKDVLYLGIKGSLVYLTFFTLQAIILHLVASPFDYPVFDLKEFLLDFTGTFHLFLDHNPIHTAIFLTLGGIVFYITSFFAEIGLAKFADTKKISAAFNFVSIYRSIKLFGFRRYTRDYTSIILVIVILTYVKSSLPQFFWFDNILGMILGFMIFATQYLGIGSVYCEIKDIEQKRVNSQYSRKTNGK
jgi:divalent metal cation (Fe/Co/Zn/Cd) transporter